MKFTIHGKSTALAPPLPPRIRGVLDFLTALPDGELLERFELAARLGMDPNSISHASRWQALQPHKAERWPGRRELLYGNTKTIEAWKARHA